MHRPTSERSLVFLVGAVQFVNILDFMIVMPLGPDFARSLHIPLSSLGYIGGSYTAAAAVSGIAGSFFLDRFDRRRALTVAMLGLILGTASASLARGLAELMLARITAGAFGGPATSLAYAIVADRVPAGRRGRAMGALMGAFAAASVLGVPAGLELSRLGGWQTPFLAVAGLGAIVVAATFVMLPPLRTHLDRPASAAEAAEPSLRALFGTREVALSYAMTACAMMAGFVLIPNIAAYLLENLQYPREHLGLLYMVGGTMSFVATRVGGRVVDKYGSFRAALAATALILAVTQLGFVTYPDWLPIPVVFVFFMVGMGLRNVAYNTLTSKVPAPRMRARFMSIQSAVQHIASAVGAFASSQLLTETRDGRLAGIPRVAVTSMVLAALVPVFVRAVENRVAARDIATQPESHTEPHEPMSGIAPSRVSLAPRESHSPRAQP